MLDENKLVYQEVDVSTDKAALEDMVKKTGQLAVPVIDINGEMAVGFDEKWIKDKLGLSYKTEKEA